jgi:hypothetical protein
MMEAHPMQEKQSVRRTLFTGLGLALVVLSVLLAVPTVSVVRADEPPVSDPAPGPTCAAEDPEQSRAAIIGRLESAVEQMRPSRGEGEAPPGFVTLNGRGYNYGPARSAEETELIRAMIERRSQTD